MTDTARGRAPAARFAFAVGLWLALLQYAYYFLLEVHLTSRASSFFVALFFWLVGLLAGLNLRSPRAFGRLVVAAPLAYYATFGLLTLFPYRLSLLPVAGAGVAVAGMLSGAFFPHARARFGKAKLLFLHENNGFVLGILVSLVGSVLAGRLLLALGPALGLLPVAAMLSRERAPSEAPQA